MGGLMQILDTPIADLKEIRTAAIRDHRGAFCRFFCAQELAPLLGRREIVQINFSRTEKAGSLRGMHFQNAPAAEMKLVRCLKGRAYDVAVDLRPSSPTFKRWHAVELDADRQNMIAIPEGFAHGFQALEEGCELLYLHTAAYDKSAEGGVRYDDPALAIGWPLPVRDVSERDEGHPLIQSGFKGIIL